MEKSRLQRSISDALNFRPVSLPERRVEGDDIIDSIINDNEEDVTLKISDPATAFRLPKTILATVDVICASKI